MKVVISGSRSIQVLPKEAINSLDKIIELGFHILIGDAPGVDCLVQQYLKSKNYNKVIIYFVGQKPRNNAGFQCHKLSGHAFGEYATRMGKGSAYSARDNFMCSQADYGLAIWDGVSKGTAQNIKRVPNKTKVIQVRMSDVMYDSLIKMPIDSYQKMVVEFGFGYFEDREFVPEISVFDLACFLVQENADPLKIAKGIWK